MSTLTIERPVFMPDMALAEAVELRHPEVLSRFGGLALRGAEVSMPEDLCDLSRVSADYQSFIQTIKPRAENEVLTPQSNERSSLYHMLYGAAEGSQEANAGVAANAETIITENICKDGSILEVDAEMSHDGQIIQFGQTTRDRQRKTLEWYPNQSKVLRANTIAEGHNANVIEHLWKQGMMRGKKALEISLVPKAPRQELFEYGYFLDRMTAVVRLTEISEQGKVKIESGLVGGVDQDALPSYKADETQEDEMTRYDQALELRFDDEIAGEMLEILGVSNARNMSTTEKLASVAVLPGDIDILDVIQLYDQLASIRLGKPVFYGLRSLWKEHCVGRVPTREDYRVQRQRSQRQQADLKATAKEVARETIRRRADADNDLQAIRLLAEVAKNHVTRFVIERPTLDARIIIGREAAVWAAEAQIRLEWGDIAGVERFTAKAQETARPTGCPAGGSSTTGDVSKDTRDSGRDKGDDELDRSDLFKKKTKSTEKNGKKTEWMRCVHCPLCERDGVDARIDYYSDKKLKRITCTSCKGHKDYGM